MTKTRPSKRSAKSFDALKDNNLLRVVGSSLFQHHTSSWFVAGTTGNGQDSWAEIKTDNGFHTVHAYKRNDKGVVVKTPLRAFQCLKPVEELPDVGIYQDTDLRWSLYALHLALKAAEMACEQEDWPLARTMLDTLTPHVPWLGDALNLSNRLHPNDPDNALANFATAMQSTDIWNMALSQDTARHELLEPWLRIALFLNIMSGSAPTNGPSLWTLDNPKGDGPRLHAWFNPTSGMRNAYQILMDDSMRALFVTTTYPTWTTHESVPEPGMCWRSIDKGPQSINTWAKWQENIGRCPGVIDQWYNTFKNTIPQQLTPQQAGGLVEKWALDCTNTIAWQKKPKSVQDILVWSMWAVQTWKQHQPVLGLAFDALTNDEESRDILHVDGWRQTISGLLEAQKNPRPPEVLTLPNDLYENTP